MWNPVSRPHLPALLTTEGPVAVGEESAHLSFPVEGLWTGRIQAGRRGGTQARDRRAAKVGRLLCNGHRIVGAHRKCPQERGFLHGTRLCRREGKEPGIS